MLPLPHTGRYASALIVRYLLLNCLTRSYAPLWDELYCAEFSLDSFTAVDPILPDFRDLKQEWTWQTPLRSHFSRRQALLELDVLTSLAVGLCLEELITIYRVQFAVLQTYDSETWYDRQGKIVFTVNRGIPGVGLDRKQFEEVKRATLSESLPAWASAYTPPFQRPDREADYERAFLEFSKRFS